MSESVALWLNAAVSRRRTYQRESGRRRRGWLAGSVLFTLALVGVIAWRLGGPVRHSKKFAQHAATASGQSISQSAPAGTPQVQPAALESEVYPRPVRDVLEAQIALERQRISSGSIDGVMGPQTRAAIRAFQRKTNLPGTGELDAETKARLTLAAPPLGACTIRSNDLARLQPLGKTWLEKSQQSALEFESILELMAEQGHSHPALLRAINRGVDWTHVSAGISLEVPVVTVTEPAAKAAFVRIGLAEKILEVFDAETNLLGHFPCSIAQHVEKRPVGELRVAVLAPNPNYTFDPELFPESDEARQSNTKLVIPPGPNNPVGTVWIGLDKPGYGMHGTANPEAVGRTESHGCFRMANWNAELLLELVWIGMPVYVGP